LLVGASIEYAGAGPDAERVRPAAPGAKSDRKAEEGTLPADLTHNIDCEYSMTDATSQQLLADSRLLGAAFRGLPASAVDCQADRFRYVNCLGRGYMSEPRDVKAVAFGVSRYGREHQTIHFPSGVSEREAIEAAEGYLSQPLTEDFYERVRTDTFHGHGWAVAQKHFACRGATLTDAVFLEVARLERGTLVLLTGS
jgi:hypothetical protein